MNAQCGKFKDDDSSKQEKHSIKWEGRLKSDRRLRDDCVRPFPVRVSGKLFAKNLLFDM
jgi:hypothetical protein